MSDFNSDNSCTLSWVDRVDKIFCQLLQMLILDQ